MDFLDNAIQKRSKTEKRTSPSNFAYLNWSGFRISISTNNLDFLIQICHKKEYR